MEAYIMCRPCEDVLTQVLIVALAAPCADGGRTNVRPHEKSSNTKPSRYRTWKANIKIQLIMKNGRELYKQELMRGKAIDCCAMWWRSKTQGCRVRQVRLASNHGLVRADCQLLLQYLHEMVIGRTLYLLTEAHIMGFGSVVIRSHLGPDT